MQGRRRMQMNRPLSEAEQPKPQFLQEFGPVILASGAQAARPLSLISEAQGPGFEGFQNSTVLGCSGGIYGVGGLYEGRRKAFLSWGSSRVYLWARTSTTSNAPTFPQGSLYNCWTRTCPQGLVRLYLPFDCGSCCRRGFGAGLALNPRPLNPKP